MFFSPKACLINWFDNILKYNLCSVYGDRIISMQFLKCGRPLRSEVPVCPELVHEKEFIRIKTEEETKVLSNGTLISINISIRKNMLHCLSLSGHVEYFH